MRSWFKNDLTALKLAIASFRAVGILLVFYGLLF